MVYGRPDFSQVDPVKVLPIPQIREIIRIPREPPVPLGKRKRGHSQRARSKTAEPGGPHSKNNFPFNPEDGWDADTPSNATVLDYRTGQEVDRRTGTGHLPEIAVLIGPHRYRMDGQDG